MYKTILVNMLGIMIILFLSQGIYSGEKSSMRGLIIYASENFIEVKWGDNEYEFFFTDGTEVYYKQKKADMNAVRICQIAEVFYSKDREGVRHLERIEIKRSSYCYR